MEKALSKTDICTIETSKMILHANELTGFDIKEDTTESMNAMKWNRIMT